MTTATGPDGEPTDAPATSGAGGAGGAGGHSADEGAVDALTPIPGARLDVPPRPVPALVERLEQRSAWVGVTWEAVQRFRVARGPVLAGGTAYYAFLAVFSLAAFVYGIAALVDAEQLAEWMTDALEQALPGLVGDEGIDPATLQEVGRTASVAGLAVLLYSGSAVMVATSDSLHAIYGAPPDGRTVVTRRVHLLGWLAVLGPLVAASFVASSVIAALGAEVVDGFGVTSDGGQGLVTALALAATLALDIGVAAVLLSRLGGIRPPTRPLRAGAVVGGLTATVLKMLMGVLIAWSLRKPQFGSFAVPIAALVVLWFQALGLYAAAALTAAAASADPPRPRRRHRRPASRPSRPST